LDYDKPASQNNGDSPWVRDTGVTLPISGKRRTVLRGGEQAVKKNGVAVSLLIFGALGCDPSLRASKPGLTGGTL
jgi:hypothetical protein